MFLYALVNMPEKSYAQSVFQLHDSITIRANNDDVFLWGGLNTPQLSHLDVNGDGQNEMLIYERSSDAIKVFEFIQGKWIWKAGWESFIPDTDPGWIMAVDFDGDGSRDLFSNGSRGVVVYRNIGLADEFVQFELIADPLFSLGFSGPINLIVNGADIPLIDDIDRDGDLDILTYNFATGGYIRFHENFSMDRTGNPGLDFELVDRLWGSFEECFCEIYAFGNETCPDIIGGRIEHAGGKSLLALDVDLDGDKDLFAGQEECNTFHFFENVNDVDSAVFQSFRTDFLDNEKNDWTEFPAGYLVNANLNGKLDLVVSSNAGFDRLYLEDFASNVFLFTDVDNNLENKAYTKSDFIQEYSLDLGIYTKPIFHDIDADGDQDILVAYHNQVGGIALIENIGTRINPVLELKTKDFLNLSSLNITQPGITIADFTRDGELNILYYGSDTENEQVLYALDISGNQIEQLEMPGVIGDVPLFFDVDSDGDLDIILGKTTGALELHENESNAFTLTNDAFLGLERDFSLQRRNVAPFLINEDKQGGQDLAISQSTGKVKVFRNFLSNSSDTVILNFESHNFSISRKGLGERLFFNTTNSLAIKSTHLIAGSIDGGLTLFSNEDMSDLNNELIVFPNPVIQGSEIQVFGSSLSDLKIFDVSGKKVADVNASSSSIISIGTFQLKSGVYILRYNQNGKTGNRKFVVY